MNLCTIYINKYSLKIKDEGDHYSVSIPSCVGILSKTGRFDTNFYNALLESGFTEKAINILSEEIIEEKVVCGSKFNQVTGKFY
ncbi:MAG: hypothetical protein MUO21_09850 [Nitrososphaeraceae archaeon]|nr:hypothetical protein [Nitrososphaeraceae archaeon]